MKEDFCVCIPTLNAGSQWEEWLTRLETQDRCPSRVLIIDSDSDDSTPNLAKQRGLDVYHIRREEFDHGGTRQMGIDILAGYSVIVFLTQDALLSEKNSLGRLVDSFEDPAVGAAYGRQLPRSEAGLIEAHARYYNYPDKSRTTDSGQIQSLGIRAAFISNSFAAYRQRALQEVGGFPKNSIFGEDTIVAGKMLLKGWKVAYCADAVVEHSHAYGFLQEFRRYFDIGVLHAREAWFLEELGRAEGEGLKFIKSELAYLSRRNPLLIPSAVARTVLKYTGYRLGTFERKLPLGVKRLLSMSQSFWSSDR